MNYNTWYQQIRDISYSVIDTINRMHIPEYAVMVFDIDCTLIDNRGQCILPIINLFNHVKDRGIIPIIITNRLGDPDNVKYTQNQLAQCGIAGYRSLYFRSPNREDNPYRYKEKARKSIHERGMAVIASIGDQPWDIGNYGGIGFILPVY